MKYGSFPFVALLVVGLGSMASAQVPANQPTATPNVRIAHPAEIELQLKTLADQFAAAGMLDEARAAKALQERVHQAHYQRLLAIHQQQPADLSRMQVRLFVRIAQVVITPETEATLTELFGKSPLPGANVDPIQSLVCEPVRLQKLVETLEQNPGQLRISPTTHFTMPNGRSAQFRYAPELGPTVQVSPTIEAMDKPGVTLNATAKLVRSDLVKLTLAAAHGSQTPAAQSEVARSRLQLELDVHVGKTLALRGLRSSRVAAETSRVPVLGEVPGLGRLFSSTKTSTSHVDYLIFLSTEAMAPPAATVTRAVAPSGIEPAAYSPAVNSR